MIKINNEKFLCELVRHFYYMNPINVQNNLIYSSKISDNFNFIKGNDYNSKVKYYKKNSKINSYS